MVATPAQAVVNANDLTISNPENWEGGKLTFTLTYTGTTAGTFTLATAGAAETVTGVTGGTATSGTDYTAAPSRTSIYFAANTGGGSTTATVTVSTLVNADAPDVVGGTETVKLVATDDKADGAANPPVLVGAAAGVGTIWERGATTYTLRGPSASIVETATGGVQKTARITATLSAPVTAHDVTIPIEAVQDPSVTPDANEALSTGGVNRDFTALPADAAIVIPAGQLSGSLDVSLWDDSVDEPTAQYFKVQPSSSNALGAGPEGGTQVVQVGVLDDDATPVVTIGAPDPAAELQKLAFPVTLSSLSENSVTVDFRTANGDDAENSRGAIAPGDYNAITAVSNPSSDRTVTIPAYNSSNYGFVTTLGSDGFEGPETVKATISNASGATLGAAVTATGTINDGDSGPSLTTLMGTGDGLDVGDGTNRSFEEGNTGEAARTITGTITTTALSVPLKVDYTFKDKTATNGADYKGTAGSIVIPANTVNPTFTIPVKIVGDNYAESPDETFEVVLTSPNSSITGITGPYNFTITDAPVADTTPTWTTGNVSVVEGNSGKSMAKVPVTLSKPVGADVTFTATPTGSPSATETGNNATTPGDDDYDWPSPASVVIKAGTTSGYIEFPINGDTVYEKDESFEVDIDPSGVLVDNNPSSDLLHTARVAITNDDAKPYITFNNLTSGEGSFLRVNGTLNGLAQDAYRVGFAIAGAATDPATPEKDFDGPDDVATWVLSVGAGAKPESLSTMYGKFHFDVYAMPDTIDEATEAFTITATEISAVPIGFATSVGTYKITDDPSDTPPAASIRDESIGEDEGSVDVHVDLTNVGDTTGTEQAIKIPYYTVNGSAKAGEDYAETKGTLTIDAGTTSTFIKVPVINDKYKEGNENFYVKLGTPTSPYGASIAKGTGEVIIKANDGGSGSEPGGEDPGGEDPQPGAPSIKVPSKIVGAQAVSITGQAPADADVELWGAPMGGGDLKYISMKKADDKGHYSFSRWIGQGYRFATQANELNSEEATVWVQQTPVFVASSPSRGRLALAVQGNPRGPNQTVIVQRWVGGKWVNAWRGTTGSNNLWKANVSVAPRTTHSLRAFVAGYTPDGLLPGYTATKRVTIR
jgi:hypothetical protein